MALKIDIAGRSFLIGFEPAFEQGIDRLVHEDNIFQQISSGERKELDPIVRAEIMEKVKDYCSVKKLTFRIVD
ncbi:hypothetical protein [Herbaspirillum chlorophenolicum]|uniref:hypothetical protein n=1 Tax=Herbaspirillum chlorophenolicum TaxID=211589 RepID=UPI000AA839B8|nr:hypothetical protein [Herbaspirillum chlorophenolicum]